eukprot:3618854-Amphidinium_carterae.1
METTGRPHSATVNRPPNGDGHAKTKVASFVRNQKSLGFCTVIVHCIGVRLVGYFGGLLPGYMY